MHAVQIFFVTRLEILITSGDLGRGGGCRRGRKRGHLINRPLGRSRRNWRRHSLARPRRPIPEDGGYVQGPGGAFAARIRTAGNRFGLVERRRGKRRLRHRCRQNSGRRRGQRRGRIVRKSDAGRGGSCCRGRSTGSSRGNRKRKWRRGGRTDLDGHTGGSTNRRVKHGRRRGSRRRAHVRRFRESTDGGRSPELAELCQLYDSPMIDPDRFRKSARIPKETIG